ncbi:hypothetical protein Tco_0619728, partial [Tanacetum coccineum]
KNTENLNKKFIKLNEELSDSETDLYNYKSGLSQVEARLVEFKQQEIKFYEKIRLLERDIGFRDNKIEISSNELEEVKPVWNKTQKSGVKSSLFNKKNPTQSKSNMIPQAVLMRSRRKTINAAKPKAVQNVAKALACWVWKSKNRVIDHMDAQTQGRHEHDQEFDAEITTVGVEVDDIAAET